MKAMLERIARHKAGEPCGIYSVCSAHPLVIEAALVQAARHDAPFALIEATSNQVNQDGGYTGMQPAQFCESVARIAHRAGFSHDRLVYGGDHLGPNPWQSLPADDAMTRADRMIEDYISAGFRKIHLDCSMACADDKQPLSNETIASRAARLCAVAERAFARAGGEPPVYVIGTEVPVPGGAAEELANLAITAPQAAGATIETHRKLFAEAGLSAAWPRVIAAVVQPGVEFDHHKVVDYAPEDARALSRMIEQKERLVFEAHSTDYQTRSALTLLVRDHFAILKVGPALTFALREALWALDAIEQEWIDRDKVSNFRKIAIERMRAEPRHWRKYYRSRGAELDHDLEYSLSDRIRYYWPDPQILQAQELMFRNLSSNPPQPALISQYMPIAHAALRAGEIGSSPAQLVMAHIAAVLDDYRAATDG